MDVIEDAKEFSIRNFEDEEIESQKTKISDIEKLTRKMIEYINEKEQE